MIKFPIDQIQYDQMLVGGYLETYRASRIAMDNYFANQDYISAISWGDMWELVGRADLLIDLQAHRGGPHGLDFRAFEVPARRLWMYLYPDTPWPKVGDIPVRYTFAHEPNWEEARKIVHKMRKHIIDQVYEVTNAES